MKQPEIELSIVVLSYNCKDKLIACLDSVSRYLYPNHEIILVDNNSSDGTVETVKKKSYRNTRVFETGENLGFAGGNNFGVKKARGTYVLFLNPDTVVNQDSISVALDFLKKHPAVGAVTVRVNLADGSLDYSCHRGFPTPWNAFCYFSGLSKLFPRVKVFSGYTLSYLDFSTEHEVDAITGAFFMLPKSLGDKLEWFDTDFFWNGEDLDLSFRIKKSGFKIMYLPHAKIIHFKGSSGGHKRGSKTFHARFDVMRLFFEKHYKNAYPSWFKNLVLLGIRARKLLAYFDL
jgi:GT2 family glycosyltransferase